MRTVLSIVVAFALGYYGGYHSHQNVNELTRAGFVVLDPEGYECNRFDKGIYTAFPSYWTSEPKPE